jgi:serine/threonine protein phosphatase PrpC
MKESDPPTPGLAMSRAFGDRVARDCGLISTPDVIYHHLTGADQFVVIASDGIWEFMDN